MEGIIQNACIQIVRQMNKKKQYSDSEKEVFAYGLEIILDSLLKAVIYLAVGFAFGRGREVAVVMLFFGVLRKTSGGKHAKTSIMCFILTGGILAFSVSFPLMCRMSGTGYCMASAIVLFLYVGLAPDDEYYKKPGMEKQKMIQKMKSVLLAFSILAIGYVLGEYWKMAALCAAGLQGLTLAELKRS